MLASSLTSGESSVGDGLLCGHVDGLNSNKDATWGRVHVHAKVSADTKGRYLRLCVFVNTNVSVDITCKHEDAVEEGQA